VTYAPRPLRDLAHYWTSRGGVNLGIVGDTRHVAKGRSYHLGRSALTADAYSRKTARDRAGLTEAASAIDLGKLNGSFPALRAFSVWLVKRCQSNAPGTQDIREVIYSPDGHAVLRWDRERGLASEPRPGEASDSHLTHTHVSFYRDSEKRAKVGAFAPYFAPVQEAPVVENRTVAAIVTRAGYLDNELAADDAAGASLQAAKIVQYASRFLAPADDSDTDGLFKVFDDESVVYITGGSAFGNPNGITVTVGDARRIWEDIFANGLNISKVRSTLTPGSFVLSEAGYAAAVALGKSSTNFAPEDYNPLGLEVIA